MAHIGEVPASARELEDARARLIATLRDIMPEPETVVRDLENFIDACIANETNRRY